MTEPRKSRRPALRRAAFFVLFVVVALTGILLVRHPDTPLPDPWNFLEPLEVADRVTPLTGYKLRRVLATDGMCQKVLAQSGASFTPLTDYRESEQCHVRDRVSVRRLAGARLAEFETTCETALRLALWIEHAVQPAAEIMFDRKVTRVHHFASYNCRPRRTASGGSGRISTHATADAIDISGVTLSDGRRIDLATGWDAPGTGAFLRSMRDTSCIWFGATLGPDYNALHRNHLHLQNRGYGTCR